RGLLHQLGPPRARQGRADPARPAQPAKAGPPRLARHRHTRGASMFKNSVAQLVVGLAVIAWLLFQLFAPGEAQSQGGVILETILLLCGVAGVIGSLVQIGARK